LATRQKASKKKSAKPHKKLKGGDDTFTGIIGYEETVIPDVERALLSKHNILFLGLRGQAKTRMARQMTEL
jgi:magnesium chelatase subunit I